MIKIVIVITLVLLAIILLSLFFPELLLPITLCSGPVFVIGLIHGERINIFSGRKLGVMTAAKGNALAFVGSFFLPGRVTEFLKPLYYYQRSSLPVSEGISVLVVERFFDILAVLGILITTIYLDALPSLTNSTWMNSILLFSIVSLVLFVIIVFRYPDYLEKLIDYLPLIKIKKFILSVFRAFRRGIQYGIGYWSIFLTIIVWLGAVSVYWLFFSLNGDIQLNLNQVLVVFIAGTLGITITITPGGLGTFEAIITFILQKYGYSLEAALASAVGLRVVAFLPNTILVIYTIFIEGFDFVKARREAKILEEENVKL